MIEAGAKVMACSADYLFFRGTDLEIVTEQYTAWHYLAGGFEEVGAIEAVQNQAYHLILFHVVSSAPQPEPYQEFVRSIRERYVADVDPEMPAELTGRLMVRRKIEK
jgi:hypothetical protein